MRPAVLSVFADCWLSMRRKLQQSHLIITFLFVFLAIIGIGFVAQAQTVPSPDGAEILQRSYAAIGCSAIGKETTITVQGSLRFGDGITVMPVTIHSQGNHRWRSELDTPKERKVTIVNDGKGQIQHADGRMIALASHNTFHQRPMHIPCLTNIALPSAAVEANYLRVEASGADSLDVVEILPADRPQIKKLADLMKITVWISRSTGYPAKILYINAAEGDSNNTQAVEIDYSAYRVIDGLAVPFHQITHAGNTLLDLQFDSVQLNTAAADFNLR